MTTDTLTFPVSASREISFRNRLAKLTNTRITNDFDRAVLARDIRNEFELGDTGDAQMRLFLRKRLGLRTSGGYALLNLVAGLDVFPNRETWNQVGGASSIVFLLSLTATQRNKVLATLLKRISKTGYAGNLALVRNVARKLGFITVVSANAKNTPVRTLRSNLATLQNFIRDNARRLGALPDNVRTALDLGV